MKVFGIIPTRNGKYLGHKGYAPPGIKVIWIELQRMRDYVLALRAQEVASG
jgi:hypothetical protein